MKCYLYIFIHIHIYIFRHTHTCVFINNIYFILFLFSFASFTLKRMKAYSLSTQFCFSPLLSCMTSRKKHRRAAASLSPSRRKGREWRSLKPGRTASFPNPSTHLYLVKVFPYFFYLFFYQYPLPLTISQSKEKVLKIPLMGGKSIETSDTSFHWAGTSAGSELDQLVNLLRSSLLLDGL